MTDPYQTKEEMRENARRDEDFVKFMSEPLPPDELSPLLKEIPKVREEYEKYKGLMLISICLIKIRMVENQPKTI